MGVKCGIVRAHVQASHIQHVDILGVLYYMGLLSTRSAQWLKKNENYSFGYFYSVCFATPIIAGAYITAPFLLSCTYLSHFNVGLGQLAHRQP